MVAYFGTKKRKTKHGGFFISKVSPLLPVGVATCRMGTGVCAVSWYYAAAAGLLLLAVEGSLLPNTSQ
jgi:hypothetical protein